MMLGNIELNLQIMESTTLKSWIPNFNNQTNKKSACQDGRLGGGQARDSGKFGGGKLALVVGSVLKHCIYKIRNNFVNHGA